MGKFFPIGTPERNALFRYYYGSPEDAWAAVFHQYSADDRAAFRARLRGSDYVHPEGLPPEFRERWLVALATVEMMEAPDCQPTSAARKEARHVLQRFTRRP